MLRSGNRMDKRNVTEFVLIICLMQKNIEIEKSTIFLWY